MVRYQLVISLDCDRDGQYMLLSGPLVSLPVVSLCDTRTLEFVTLHVMLFLRDFNIKVSVLCPICCLLLIILCHFGNNSTFNWQQF